MKEVKARSKDTRFLSIKDGTNRFGYIYCVHLEGLQSNYLCATDGIKILAVKTSIDSGIYAKITNTRLIKVDDGAKILTDIKNQFEWAFSDEYQDVSLGGIEIDKNAVDMLAHGNFEMISCGYEMVNPEFPNDHPQLNATTDTDKVSHCISLHMIHHAYKNELYMLKVPKVNDKPWLFSDTGNFRLMLAMPMRLP